jgi:hypothetical protein
MTNDMAQVNLREPEVTDWDNYNSGGSSYVAPPPALDQNGRPIVYFGIGDAAETTPTKDGFLNVLIDPIKMVRSGQYDGYTLRFTRASVKPFQKNNQPIKGNPNALANFLRATGLAVKPQTNDDYRLAVKATKNRPFGFTIDWEAYNKDTGENVKGYLAFPLDPERPGQRKSILKQGDEYYEVDRQGNVLGTKKVQSEVLFANARLKFFQDPTRGSK